MGTERQLSRGCRANESHSLGYTVLEMTLGSCPVGPGPHFIGL